MNTLIHKFSDLINGYISGFNRNSTMRENGSIKIGSREVMKSIFFAFRYRFR